MSIKEAKFTTTITCQCIVRSSSRDSAILANIYLKCNVLGSHSLMASHGNLETTAADVLIEPRVEFAGNGCCHFFLFFADFLRLNDKRPNYEPGTIG